MKKIEPLLMMLRIVNHLQLILIRIQTYIIFIILSKQIKFIFYYQIMIITNPYKHYYNSKTLIN